jgi:hypothetical protein
MLISLKLWIFANLNMFFPVILLFFDFDEFSERVLNLHLNNFKFQKD